jgi:tRNA dimethylallyltransferase
MAGWKTLLADLPPERPVLIAGPTASGKSDLALAIAEAQGGTVINADALQVFADWRILTARPARTRSPARRTHFTVMCRRGAPILSVTGCATWPHFCRHRGPLSSVEQGFTSRPSTLAWPKFPKRRPRSAPKRMRASQKRRGVAPGRTRCRNRGSDRHAQPDARPEGMGSASHHGPRACLLAGSHRPAASAAGRRNALVLAPDRVPLGARIDRRFEAMLRAGVMDEAARNAPHFSPRLPSSKAIGAAALVAACRGEMSLDAAADEVRLLTRQYAKRQRTWFRSKMGGWKWIDPEG